MVSPATTDCMVLESKFNEQANPTRRPRIPGVAGIRVRRGSCFDLLRDLGTDKPMIPGPQFDLTFAGTGPRERQIGIITSAP